MTPSSPALTVLVLACSSEGKILATEQDGALALPGASAASEASVLDTGARVLSGLTGAGVKQADLVEVYRGDIESRPRAEAVVLLALGTREDTGLGRWVDAADLMAGQDGTRARFYHRALAEAADEMAMLAAWMDLADDEAHALDHLRAEVSEAV